ncbi:hypothetical protein TK49_06020 [Ralstonia mannitolilytica]|uniref:hypothetical protein n=1 Tax=Ralstonia mannitolilytica TaxID=105219 RepID=UPI0005D75CE7|nr:hypothetical protein [Ralstonia mannitolilytica]AJW44306.1 hypothetical protein TK49_06020 [Ralstonia mannitolilytica]
MAYLWRIAVGSNVREFEEHDSIEQAWAYLDQHMANQNEEIAIVFENNYAYRVGEIWPNYVYWAHAETPNALRMYLGLSGFFDEPEGA